MHINYSTIKRTGSGTKPIEEEKGVSNVAIFPYHFCRGDESTVLPDQPRPTTEQRPSPCAHRARVYKTHKTCLRSTVQHTKSRVEMTTHHHSEPQDSLHFNPELLELFEILLDPACNLSRCPPSIHCLRNLRPPSNGRQSVN